MDVRGDLVLSVSFHAEKGSHDSLKESLDVDIQTSRTTLSCRFSVSSQ